MDFLQILVLTLYITQAFTKSKKRKFSSSEEGSIENLLYYKDCQRSKPTAEPVPIALRGPDPTPPPLPPPPPPRQPECPFPKMCCALTCGNECGGGPAPASHMQYQTSMSHMQYPSMDQPPQSNSPFPTPVQPQIIQRRKKKVRMSPIMNPPLPTRRDFSGVTKDRIKGLISQDDDIRKILKDLVRVTMQKVDLQDMLQANQKMGFDGVSTARSESPMLYEVNDYVE